MGNWDYTGTHVVIQYLWHHVRTELGWNKDNYGGLVPIVTPAQEPEINSFSGPFAVYSYSIQPTAMWIMERDISAISVFSQKPSDVSKFVNLAKAKLERQDETARDINEFLSSLTDPNLAELKNFDIKTVSLRSANGPQPPAQEGGRYDGAIVFAVDYVQFDATGESPRQ